MGQQCTNHFCSEEIPKSENKNWMSILPNSTPIYLMTIPGTHNSCALYGTFLAQCNSWSIPNQLKAGIRYFDLRLRLNDNRLDLQHGPISQKKEFSEIIKFFSDFLKENKSEFIIMAIQKEYKENKKNKSFEELYKERIKNYKDLIVEFPNSNDIKLTLGELRGKILFINLFHYGIHRKNGITSQNDWVCNYQKNIIDKKRKVKRFFNKTINLLNIRNLFVNYLSASSDYLLVSPGQIANEVNKEVFKFKGRLGIVLCDFPGENLIGYLIEQNLSIEKLLNHENTLISYNNCVTFKNFNTGKFLSINNNNKLFCNKKEYNFLLSKQNVKDNELLISNDEIVLIGSCDFCFKIIKYSIGKNEDFNPYIINNDIVKLIPSDNKECVIVSDYEFKENKIQKVEIKKDDDKISQGWVINVQFFE